MSAAEVAKLVLVTAKTALVVVPAAVLFGVVHSWFSQVTAPAINGELATLMVAGVLATGTFIVCVDLVSRRE